MTKAKWFESQPLGGWKPNTYYVAEVQWRASNPAHKAILYTGFLGRDGRPEDYSCVFNPTYEPPAQSVDGLFSVHVLEEITNMGSAP